MPNTTPQARYATPRKYLHWDRNPQLAILKMLAWAVWHHEGVRNPDRLAERVALLFAPVVGAVTGETGVGFESLCAQTLSEQGTRITAHKLLQRADKTDRYLEFNDYADAVVAAYSAQVAGADAAR
jgi:hypothetical protein